MVKTGKQIVIPKATRRKLFIELHRDHSGISKSYLTAKELYYCPSMKSDITNHEALARPAQKISHPAKTETNRGK